MNSGIYALYWWDQDLVYIGQTVSLSRRKDQHYQSLKSFTHFNIKVQEAYSLFGLPEFIVLEKVASSSLNDRELYWGTEFAVLNSNGLNIIKPGIGPGSGVDSIASKYSKIQILKVFSLLLAGTYTLIDISKRTGVGRGVVAKVAYGESHTWLQEQYPIKYAKMLLVDRKQLSTEAHIDIKTQKTPIARIVHTSGVVYDIYNVRDFCRSYKHDTLDHSNISKLIRGVYKSYKGFTLKTN